MLEYIIVWYLHLASLMSLVSNKLLPNLLLVQSLLNFLDQYNRNQLNQHLSEHFVLDLVHILPQPYSDLLFYRRKQMDSLVYQAQYYLNLKFGKSCTNSVIVNPINCKVLQLVCTLKYNIRWEQCC